MQTAALYIRVSTDDQTEYSPDAQRRALLDYAERSGIVVPEPYIYTDEGISGRRAEKRPAFMAMIAAAKQKPKPFDLILVHKFDRFARSREDSIVYKSLLRRECGVAVVSVTEHIEDDRFSVILEAMLEAMAEYYSLNLADEVKKGMTEKARRGEYQTCAPFGYRLEHGRLFPVPENAAIVRQMYEDYLFRGKSPFGIARELNALGVRTLRGNLWENRTVKYILQNPLYKGYVRWNPEGKRDLREPENLAGNLIIERGSHEPIVSEELWQAVNDRLSAAGRTAGRKPPELHAHWLSGLLRCGGCGGSLSSAGARLSAFSAAIIPGANARYRTIFRTGARKQPSVKRSGTFCPMPPIPVFRLPAFPAPAPAAGLPPNVSNCCGKAWPGSRQRKNAQKKPICPALIRSRNTGKTAESSPTSVLSFRQQSVN